MVDLETDNPKVPFIREALATLTRSELALAISLAAYRLIELQAAEEQALIAQEACAQGARQPKH